MEWDDLKTFLAISREGTLSGAARVLGVGQTTAGRRLDALHERAGVRLLQKTPSGYVLTPAGEHILANVETMEVEALAAERVMTGEDVRLAGTVRVTTVETLAVKVLAPTLTEFRRRYPNIVLEIDIDSRPLSLARREADIALRVGKFDQQDVVVRKVGEEHIGVFAAQSYLDVHGAPDFATQCAGHFRLGSGIETTNLPVAKWFERVAARATLAIRGNVGVRFEVARAGAGIACLPVLIARDAPELVRLESPPPPNRELWLGVHRDMQRAPRIRAVLDFLSVEVKHAVNAAERPVTDTLRPLIVCADDYGISPCVSRGIRELAEAGRLSATGAMTSMPHWPEAAEAMKPLIGRIAVGLHLTLTDQRSLGPMPELAPDGRLPKAARLTRLAWTGRLPRAEIAAELSRQLEAFEIHLGRPPDFIDGHQHVHQLPGIRDIVLDRCVRKGIWVRDCWDNPGALLRRKSVEGATVALSGLGLHRRARRLNVATNNGFTGVYPFGRVTLGAAVPGMLVDAKKHTMLMVHPGHPDAELAAVDSWVEPREGEWAYLISDAFPRDLAAHGFRVATGAPFPG